MGVAYAWQRSDTQFRILRIITLLTNNTPPHKQTTANNLNLTSTERFGDRRTGVEDKGLQIKS